MLASQGGPIEIDLGDRGLNVSQPVSCRSAHNAMAWRRADSDTGSLSSSSQTTSTGSLSSSSSSSRMPDNRERRLPDPSAARSNSRSTSLSGPAVPCAIDPKSRGLLAPYLANTLRIASRCSRRRSNARLLYVLVTFRILRPVGDNQARSCSRLGIAGFRALTEVADLDNRTVLGFATKTGKTPSPGTAEKPRKPSSRR